MGKAGKRTSKKNSKSMKIVLIVLLAAAGVFLFKIYSSYMFGTYECDKLYQTMEFSTDHRVNISIMSIKNFWKYEVAGGKVNINNENGESIVFEKIKGKLVTRNVLLGNITCSKK